MMNVQILTSKDQLPVRIEEFQEIPEDGLSAFQELVLRRRPIKCEIHRLPDRPEIESYTRFFVHVENEPLDDTTEYLVPNERICQTPDSV